MRTITAIFLGKLISKLSRQFKIGGGSAAPGLYALKADPNLVSKLSKKIPRNIIITGTNGKTTTARMLAHFAKNSELKVIRNHTGSNLERGIASTLITYKGKADLGIWELDEAAFNTVAPKLNPDIIVFLNVFRDQLDRYGEINNVTKNWAKTLKNLPKKALILANGDDDNTAKLGSLKFGVRDFKIVGETITKKTGKQVLNCEVRDVKLHGLKGSSFSVLVHKKPFPAKLSLPGVYHIYDFLAAFYAGHELGFSTRGMIKSLKGFQPAFGRVEKFSLQPRRLHRKDNAIMFLIKNPAGATQVFQTIAPQIHGSSNKKNDRILLALNDNLADGTDVSWIWDAEFEFLLNPKSRGATTFPPPRWDIIVSGSRGTDMAVRLKYAGFNSNQITVIPNLQKALAQARRGLKGTLYILPTYTAMLELQGILTKMGIKRNYWEES